MKWNAMDKYKIYVKYGTFIIFNCLIILKLNNLLNICALNDLYVFYLYCVFVVHNGFNVLFYIVKLDIIFVYYQFYRLCMNKDYYYI